MKKTTAKITLYPFDLEKNYNQFQELIVNSLPATVSQLGWLANTGYYNTDPAGNCAIWTSYPDPRSSKDDIVVWIFDSHPRIRIFVTSEVVLDKAEYTSVAVQLAKAGIYAESDRLPTYFKDPSLEELYHRSKELLKAVMHEYMYQNKREYDDVLFHYETNCLWAPLYYEIVNVDMASTCFRFVKPVSEFDADKSSPPLLDDLKMFTLGEADVKFVHGMNKIAFEFEYVKDCLRNSTSAIRKKESNEMIVWSMTHRDMFIGSLHVLPEYRRRGYAEIILQDLCRQYVDHYKRTLSAHLAKKAYFGAAVETYNEASANLFRKAGWKSIGLGHSWIRAEKKKREEVALQ